MAQNPFTSVERKWLSLYEPREGSLLAKRISRSNCMLSMASKPEAAQDAGVLPIELWLSIALHMGAAASRLAEVCWGLRGCGRSRATRSCGQSCGRKPHSAERCKPLSC